MQPMTWRIGRILMPMSWDPLGERLMEVRVQATWEEPAEGRDKVTPSAELTFWLPERLDWTLAQIEDAALAYVREHLPRLVEALPPART